MNNKIKTELKKDRQERRGVNMRYEMLRSMFAFACVMALGILLYGCGKSENAVTGPVNNDLLSGAANTSEFESKAPEEMSDNSESDLQNDMTEKTTFADGSDISTSGASYLDMATCKASGCHDTIYTTYSQTNHATAWSRKVSAFDTYAKAGRKYCTNCHTVNGAFLDVDSDHKYTAGTDKPSFGIAPVDYQSQIDGSAKLPSTVVSAEFQGIQCENCHGPASLHVNNKDNNKIVKGKRTATGGKTPGFVWSVGGPASSARICGTCHPQNKDWRKSMHSIAMLIDEKNPAEHASEYLIGSGTTKTGSCATCHTSEGFVYAIENGYEPKDLSTLPWDPDFKSNINCVTCHDPHGVTGNAAQLRVSAEELCMKCHNQRYSAGAYVGASSGAGANIRLLHQPQREMFIGGVSDLGKDGQAAYDFDGKALTAGRSMGPSTACYNCHMYAKTDRSKGIEWTGHTFNPRVEACEECHSGMNGKSIIKLRQTSFKKKMEELENKLKSLQDKLEAQIQSDKGNASYSLYPSATYTEKRCGKAIKDGYTEYSTWAKRCAWAEFNLKFAEEDHSKGMHNGPYAEKIFEQTEKMLTWLEANAMK